MLARCTTTTDGHNDMEWKRLEDENEVDRKCDGCWRTRFRGEKIQCDGLLLLSSRFVPGIGFAGYGLWILWNNVSVGRTGLSMVVWLRGGRCGVYATDVNDKATLQWRARMGKIRRHRLTAGITHTSTSTFSCYQPTIPNPFYTTLLSYIPPEDPYPTSHAHLPRYKPLKYYANSSSFFSFNLGLHSKLQRSVCAIRQARQRSRRITVLGGSPASVWTEPYIGGDP